MVTGYAIAEKTIHLRLNKPNGPLAASPWTIRNTN